MTSNYNINDRTHQYSKSQIMDNYPITDINTMSYDGEDLWEDNEILNNRLTSPRRQESHTIRSNTLNERINTKSRDEFSIYGSFIRQRSERKRGVTLSEQEKINQRQDVNFKNLPVKISSRSSYTSSEYSNTISSPSVSKRPDFTLATNTTMNYSIDQVKNRDYIDTVTPKTRSNIEAVPTGFVTENIVPTQKAELKTNPQEYTSQIDPSTKDNEIEKLRKNVGKLTKKLSLLQNNNQTLQEHLKNLLDERRQLLKQIENSEFEEIIEEEEVQQAKPNCNLRENVTKIQYVKEPSISKTTEISHVNCLQKEKITLDDIPQRMLESFRNDILRNEREKADMEKRSLIETLKIQQQKQIQSLKDEYESQRFAAQQVTVQSYKKTRFNQTVSETNFQLSLPPKNVLHSVGVHAFPAVLNKHCQCEVNKARNSINKFLTTTTISKWQKSVFENVMKSVEDNDFESLVSVLDRAICRPMTSVGVNYSPIYISKSTNTIQVDCSDVMVEVNTISEVVKPRVSQESRAILVKPTLLQRGCQPEDIFKFETGTMTDQLFCRSQGMMTVADYSDHKSSNFEVDSVINRSTNRSESRKQTISHKSFLSSPTKEFINVHERSISPNVNKVTKISPIETNVEKIVKVNINKSGSVPKSKGIVEETEHFVEKKTEHVTSILDSRKMPKSEVPTMIECWETVSHFKNGELIKDSETYHDRLVITDPEKIQLQLNQKQDNELLIRSSKSNNSSKLDLGRKDLKEIKVNLQDSSLIDNSLNSINVMERNIQNNLSNPSSSTNIHHESEHKFKSENVKKPAESKDTEFQKAGFKSSLYKTTYNESDRNIFSGNLKNLDEFKDKKSFSKTSSLEKTTYDQSESTFLSESGKKPIEIKEIEVSQNVSHPFLKETSYYQSGNTTTFNSLKKPKEVKIVKIEQAFSKPSFEKSTYNQSENIFHTENSMKPKEIKEITVVEKLSKPSFKESVYYESEQTSTFSNLKKPAEIEVVKVQDAHFNPSLNTLSYSQYGTDKRPTEVKDIKVVHNFSHPSFKETSYHQSENTTTFNTLKKPIEVEVVKVEQAFSKPSLDKTTYNPSDSTFYYETSMKPIEIKEIAVVEKLSKLSLKENTYNESELTSNLKKPSEIEVGNVQDTNFKPSSEKHSYYKSETDKKPTETKDIKVIQNFSHPSFNETTYYESEQRSNFNSLKKPIEDEFVKVEQAFSKPSFDKATYNQSNSTFHSNTSMKPIEIKEIPVVEKHSKPSLKENTYYESEQTTTFSNLKKPSEIEVGNVQYTNFKPSSEKHSYYKSETDKKPTETKDIKVIQNFSHPSFNETTYYESEQRSKFNSLKKPIEVEEPLFEKSTYNQSESTFLSETMKKPTEINVSKSSLTETIYNQSKNNFAFSNLKKPTEIEVMKIQQTFSKPSIERTTYDELDRSVASGNFENINDNKEVKISQNAFQPSLMENTVHESYQMITSSNLSKPNEIKNQHFSASPFITIRDHESDNKLISEGVKKPVEFNIRHNTSATSLKEVTYHESMETHTTTTTSSIIPVAVESGTDKSKSIVTKVKNPNNSIGNLTSPKSFQSYSSSKGKFNFPSDKTKNYSLDNTSKTEVIPVQVKSITSTLSSGHNIPVNVSLLEPERSKTTRIPITVIANSNSSTSNASNKSAFYSMSSSQETSTTVKPVNIPITTSNLKKDYSEVLLSENIFHDCSQLLLWLKSINVVTTSTINTLPSNLITVSSSIIDWWVDVTIKVAAVQLEAIISYVISTFSKNLLKYLIINLDQQGNSCLHYIIGHQMWDSYDVLHSTNLLEADIFNTQGFTVVMVACTNKITTEHAQESLRKLVKGANLNLKSKLQGQTAIFIAALHNNSAAIKILYDNGANINMSDNNDNTPLMIACSKNYIDTVTVILSLFEVLVDQKNKEGKSALGIIEEAHFSDLLEIFRQWKAERAESARLRIGQNSYSSKSFRSRRF